MQHYCSLVVVYLIYIKIKGNLIELNFNLI